MRSIQFSLHPFSIFYCDLPICWPVALAGAQRVVTKTSSYWSTSLWDRENKIIVFVKKNPELWFESTIWADKFLENQPISSAQIQLIIESIQTWCTCHCHCWIWTLHNDIRQYNNVSTDELVLSSPSGFIALLQGTTRFVVLLPTLIYVAALRQVGKWRAIHVQTTAAVRFY